MGSVRVVWGVGSADTAVAAYDAALADANLHDYNLLPVSSVLPAAVSVDPVGRAPDLGPAGGLLPVVEARVTATDAERMTAGLGWIVSAGGSGVIYEAADQATERTIETRIRRGLADAAALRNWSTPEPTIRTVTTTGRADQYTTALVLAAFGRSEPIV